MTNISNREEEDIEEGPETLLSTKMMKLNR